MRPNSRIEAGERLRAERERLGLSQAELAERLGIDRMTQGKYEAGKRSPNADYLAALAGLGADAGFVVSGAKSTTVADLLAGITRAIQPLAERFSFDAVAVTAILLMTIQDESEAGRSTAGRLMSEDVVHEMIKALRDDGLLLGRIFSGVIAAMDKSQHQASGAKLAEIVLTLYRVFKGAQDFNQDVIAATVRVAMWKPPTRA